MSINVTVRPAGIDLEDEGTGAARPDCPVHDFRKLSGMRHFQIVVYVTGRTPGADCGL